jgi:ABC transport system ATP-binding/permease protein
VKAAAPVKTKKTLSTKEQKELDAMESALHAAEGKLKAAKAQLEDPAVATDVAKLLERQKLVDVEKANVEALFKRWEELEAKLKKIQVG